MIEKATMADLDAIESAYREHFAYEREHGAYTAFREGVYPTRHTAETAIQKGTLYLYREAEALGGSMIFDREQPDRYASLCWKVDAPSDKVCVLHLLMVRPSRAGRGIASALIRYAIECAERRGDRAIRLDTGRQNLPAVALYTKWGFRPIGTATMDIGGLIPHEGHLFFEKAL